MPQLKLIQPPARLRAPSFNRELNRALLISRAFGTSLERRIPRAAALAAKLKADEKYRAKPGEVPAPGKLARIVSPALFGRKRLRRPLRPCKAEVETILTASDKREYARLTNGQIVKAATIVDVNGTGTGVRVIQTPGSQVTLKPADLEQLPTQELPRTGATPRL